MQAHTRESPGTVLGKPFAFFLANHLSLSGIPRYVGTNNLEFGVKFGEWHGTGIRLYASYYSGLNIFSQYYNMRESGWGVGFTFDVW
jgi:hypothetical protein